MQRRFETVLIGAGPAGTGLLVAAAQRGCLDARLDDGWAIVDDTTEPGRGALGSYDVLSDSCATSFVECLEAEAARALLAPAGRTEAARRLIAHRHEHVPLGDVAEFLGHVAGCLRERVARAPESTWLSATRARRLSRHDGLWQVELDRAGASTTLSARRVVLATGARQLRRPLLQRSVAGLPLDRWRERLLPSTWLLRRGGRALIERARHARGGPWVVVGGSHSAFSAAHLLEGVALTVLHRSPIRVFYPTPAAARAEGVDVDETDICPFTGRLHRLGGLRGEGRAMWRRITGRATPPATDVRLHRYVEPAPGESDGEIERLFDTAAWIVPAMGYRPRTPPIEEYDGRPISLAVDRGERLVDAACRVLSTEGQPIAGLYAMGLAAGWIPPGEPSFAGETNGVWLYHNVNGARLLDSLSR